MKSKPKLLHKFIQDNFFIDSNGELHYKWKEDTEAVHSKIMIRYIKQQHLKVLDSRE